jgi:hypothetical protein
MITTRQVQSGELLIRLYESVIYCCNISQASNIGDRIE